MELKDWLELGTVVVAAISAGSAAWSARHSARSAAATEKNIMVGTLAMVAQKWTEIYPKRNLLLGDTDEGTRLRKAYEEFEKRGNAKAFFDSKEWQEDLRPVLHFFELMGIYVHQGMIAPDLMFDIVTVERWDSPDGGRPEACNGALYKRLKPTLDFVRQTRGSMYDYYDKFLLPLYFEHYQRIGADARTPGWWQQQVKQAARGGSK